MAESIVTKSQPTAFLSYTPFKNEKDQEKLLQLRETLEEEVVVQTGEPFNIFACTTLEGNNRVEDSIQTILENSTLLIVLITPGYLKSENCRKEFLCFLDAEKKLERDDLILPILYIDTPALQQEYEDPIVRELRKRSIVDCRSLRFESLTSTESRKQLSKLAEQISTVLDSDTGSQKRFKDSKYSMRVTKLNCVNFRGFHKLDIEFHKRLNVFVGVNGAGKSTILESLAFLLSQFSDRMIGESRLVTRLLREETTVGESKTTCSIETFLNDQPTQWSVGRSNQEKYSGDFRELKTVVERIQTHLAENDQLSLPVLVYYSVNRTVSGASLVQKKVPYNQLSGYDSLRGKLHDFDSFFEWFRQREDLENELLRESLKKQKTTDYEDRELKAVRLAISKLMPGFSDPRIQREPLRMIVTKDGMELVIDQLSDGEKCLLALVGDLASKLSIANPSLDDPLRGSGIILIDEIDLHLHPDWQRQVIPRLLETFPNLQFILSTHSPQVLSKVPGESVFILDQFQILEATPHTEGRDSNSILTEIMGVSERPEDVIKELKQCFNLIDTEDFKAAKQELDRLRNKLGNNDPEIIRANTLIDFLE